MPKGHQVFSRSVTGGSRFLRAINDRLLIQTDSITSLGSLHIVTADHSFDVMVSRVLDIGPKAKCSTRKGPLKVGDKILSVRVVNKSVESVDMRSEGGQRVSLCPAEHAIAVVAEAEILPINDCLLVRGQPDRRDYGLITLMNDSKATMISCEILATGPDVTQGEPGEYAVAPSVNGVSIDSLVIRKSFGSDLRIIREKSVHAISTEEIVEAKFVPDQIVDDRAVRLL